MKKDIESEETRTRYDALAAKLFVTPALAAAAMNRGSNTSDIVRCPHTGAVCRKECTIRPDCEFRAQCAVNGAKGGKASRRKLTKKEARRIAMVRWAAGAGRGAVKASKQSGARSHTAGHERARGTSDVPSHTDDHAA